MSDAGRGADTRVANRRRRVGLPVLATLLGLALPAAAAAATSQVYTGQFSTSSANTSAGLSFSTSSSDDANTANNNQPKAVREYDIALPAGTAIDTGAAPRCTATDAEILADPTGACPAGSNVGTGNASYRLPFSGAADVPADVTVFNADNGLIIYVDPSPTADPFTFRASFVNGTLKIPVAPQCIPPATDQNGQCKRTDGNPGDWEAIVAGLDFSVGPATSGTGPTARNLITTPATCVSPFTWKNTATMSYADGTTAAFDSFQGCNATTPVLSTAASSGGLLGTVLSATTTLSNATGPSGSIVFSAYGPNDENCSGTPAFTSAPVPVSGVGAYQSPAFTPSQAGAYRWIAAYSGDGTNAATTSVCDAAGTTASITSPTDHGTDNNGHDPVIDFIPATPYAGEIHSGGRSKSRVAANGAFTVSGTKITAGPRGARVTGTVAGVTRKNKVSSARLFAKKRGKPIALGHTTFDVAAGKTVSLKVKLSKKGLSALRKARKLKVSIAIQITSPGTAPVRNAISTTLLAPKKK